MIDFDLALSPLVPPDDATLAALSRACAAAPLDETALLVYADRLDELDRPALASFARFCAAHLLFQRTAFDAITRSLAIPSHLFSPNGTTSNG